jgi:hypothetical protein
MITLPEPGLYRTTKPYPGYEEQIPANVLVYVGVNPDTNVTFVVRPGVNRINRWFWGEPTIPLRSASWGQSLQNLPPEGFYTLPEDLAMTSSRWLKNAVVQLGYNGEARGILFVAEQHANEQRNVLIFSDKGVMIEDSLLFRLQWAPILPVAAEGQS